MAEFVGPSDGEKLGLSKVAKFYYAPGWREGGAMLHLVVNIDEWNELPKSYQAILFQAAEAANQEGVRFACGVPRRVAALVGGQPAAKRAGARAKPGHHARRNGSPRDAYLGSRRLGSKCFFNPDQHST